MWSWLVTIWVLRWWASSELQIFLSCLACCIGYSLDWRAILGCRLLLLLRFDYCVQSSSTALIEQSFEHVEVVLRAKQLRYVLRTKLLLLSLGRQRGPPWHTLHRNLMIAGRVRALGAVSATHARSRLTWIFIIIVKRATHGLSARANATLLSFIVEVRL